jgi:hypothetical protein
MGDFDGSSAFFSALSDLSDDRDFASSVACEETETPSRETSRLFREDERSFRFFEEEGVRDCAVEPFREDLTGCLTCFLL